MTMFSKSQSIQVSKLDAAQRQLQTAIRLWFYDDDPVAIHTLVHAAYEIIHAISKQRNPYRPDLLFDSDLIRDEYRAEVARRLKRPGNFFKHANKDGNDVIEFNPDLSQGFIIFSIFGMRICGERISDEEAAFNYWLMVHSPELLTEKGRKSLADNIPVENLRDIERFTKREFFDTILTARRLHLRR